MEDLQNIFYKCWHYVYEGETSLMWENQFNCW